VESRRTSPLKSLFDEVRSMIEGRSPRRVVLLVGGIGGGKTAAGLRLLSLLRQAGIPTGGILAPRIMKGDETIGYSVVDVATNTTHPFAGLEPQDIQIGRYFVSRDSIARAHKAVLNVCSSCDVVFVDEVGRLELKGGGHAPAVRQLLHAGPVAILLVRDEWVDEVRQTFGIDDPLMFRVETTFDRSASTPAGIRTFWQIVDEIRFPLLVTQGDEGFPESRPMALVERQEDRLWFATSRASRKIRQVEKDPRVSVLFVDTDRFNYATLHGNAFVVTDPELGRSFWQEAWRDDWPDGPSDPDYVLLRVDVVRGHYLRGATGESGIVDIRSDISS